ncbi:MAG TPA: TetR family transcriptional regulator [Acidimicrobiales bacterium]|nr:TetR family transcriptional regulator [Acidimicrobiales bacterium]
MQTRAQTRRIDDAEQTREKLIAAAEQLFARQGIHQVRLREIYALAGQRNSSALHYHFGTREGLVEAILLAHQSRADESIKARLDRLEATGRPVSLRQLLEAVVPAMTEQLGSDSGRNFLRIIPQILDQLSHNLRSGKAQPATLQSRRVLSLLESALPDLPEPLRRERIVTYVVTLTALLAERAHHLESGIRPTIDNREFSGHLVDTLEAILQAPSHRSGPSAPSQGRNGSSSQPRPDRLDTEPKRRAPRSRAK